MYNERVRKRAFDPLAEKQGYTTEMAGDIMAIQNGLVHPDTISQKHFG